MPMRAQNGDWAANWLRTSEPCSRLFRSDKVVASEVAGGVGLRSGPPWRSESSAAAESRTVLWPCDPHGDPRFLSGRSPLASASKKSCSTVPLWVRFIGFIEILVTKLKLYSSLICTLGIVTLEIEGNGIILNSVIVAEWLDPRPTLGMGFPQSQKM
jgi:hypothetical protein